MIYELEVYSSSVKPVIHIEKILIQKGFIRTGRKVAREGLCKAPTFFVDIKLSGRAYNYEFIFNVDNKQLEEVKGLFMEEFI